MENFTFCAVLCNTHFSCLNSQFYFIIFLELAEKQVSKNSFLFDRYT